MIKVENGIELEMSEKEIQELKDIQLKISNSPADEIIQKEKKKIYKSTFIMRCTEEELEQLLNRLATENIKFREMYAACDFFLIDDSMYSVLHWTVADELGEVRADELLEPEE